jgi:hypothetical protein
MPKTNRKKGYRVATSPLKKVSKKSAMDALKERFSKIIETGSRNMDSNQLRESEKKFNDAVDRAVSNKQRHETA